PGGNGCRALGGEPGLAGRQVVQSKVAPNRKGNGWREEPVAAINGGIRSPLHIAERAANDLAREGPIPALAFMSEPQAPDVEVRVRHQRSVVSVGGGGLAEEVSRADKVALAQLTGHSKLVEEARLPVERENADVLDDRIFDRVPVRPV